MYQDRNVQSCVNTIEHSTAARDAALVSLCHGSRAPPRALAELICRVVLLSLSTVFDRSEVCSVSSFLGRPSLDLLRRTRLSCHRRPTFIGQVDAWRTRAASEAPSGDERP